jgi:hypothetical protein
MIRKLMIFAGMTLSLSGCGKWLNEYYYTSEIIQGRDFAPYGHPYNPKPLYCYKTLAGADCYAHPQPEREGQLIEAYNPPPPCPKVNYYLYPLPEKHEPCVEAEPISMSSSAVGNGPIHLSQSTEQWQ